MPRQTRRLVLVVVAASLAAWPAVAAADNVVADDQIVQGSQCVGLDCINNESFGFDTLRLKENNLRIGFDDTSVGAFPNNDWQLTANDAASGGANYFSIDDVTGATTPFKVMAAARTNALLVSPTGKIGVGTASPVMDVDINTNDTPGVRLAQGGGGGFTPQTWDVAGNEANFFVRDVTGGSRLPFRIRPGAPTSSVDIAASGNVGVGTASPTAPLDVTRSDGTAKAVVRETSATTAPRTLGVLSNNGPAALQLTDTNTGTNWTAGTTSGSAFALTPTAGPAAVTVTSDGTLTGAGALLQSADAAGQSNVATLDPDSALAAVRTLPVQTFSYTADASGATHAAPAGAAFRAAFGLGSSDTALSPGDVAAVSLAAVRALAAAPATADSRVPALVTSVSGLTTSVDALTQGQDRAANGISLLRTADQTLRDSITTGVTAQAATDARVAKLKAKNTAMLKRVRALEAAVRRLTKKR